MAYIYIINTAIVPTLGRMKMIGIVTHHGHDFRVDTMDWGHHSADGDKAGWKLVEWLKALDASETAMLHRLLADEDGSDLDRTEAESKLMDEYGTAVSAALAVGFEGWLSWPDMGHNCDLIAV